MYLKQPKGVRVNRKVWYVATATLAAGAALAVGSLAVGQSAAKGTSRRVVVTAGPTESSSSRQLVSQWLSPLSWFVSGDPGSPEAQRSYEESVAACMAAKGFVYYPFDSAAGQGQPATVSAMTSYRNNFGYGLTASQSTASHQSPASPATTLAPEPAALQGQSASELGSALQANEAYVASLSPARRQTYYEALSGGLLTGEPGATGLGCEAQANIERSANLPVTDPAIRAAYTADLSADFSSPAWSAALTAWRACMQSAGWKLASPQAAIDLASSKISAASSAGPNAIRAAEQMQLQLARTDWSCQLKTTEPAIQKLQMAQVATLARQFPQFAARAAQA